MTHIIWITGRAATGKSTLVAALRTRLRSRGVPPTVLSDGDLLHNLRRADTTHTHHWHPYGDDRIRFRTGYLFDEGLRLINARLRQALGQPGLVLVELARGQRVPPVDVTYRRPLQLIDPLIWAHSTVFRLDTHFATQLLRNQHRISTTGHGTPNEIMRSLYAADDPDSFVNAGVPVATLRAATLDDSARWILNAIDDNL